MTQTFNGWANHATWNIALWIQNDQFLYNTAKACVEYKEENELPYTKFKRCMMFGQVGRHLEQTPDGIKYDNIDIDEAAINEMMYDL